MAYEINLPAVVEEARQISGRRGLTSRGIVRVGKEIIPNRTDWFVIYLPRTKVWAAWKRPVSEQAKGRNAA